MMLSLVGVCCECTGGEPALMKHEGETRVLAPVHAPIGGQKRSGLVD